MNLRVVTFLQPYPSAFYWNRGGDFNLLLFQLMIPSKLLAGSSYVWNRISISSPMDKLNTHTGVINRWQCPVSFRTDMGVSQYALLDSFPCLLSFIATDRERWVSFHPYNFHLSCPLRSVAMKERKHPKDMSPEAGRPLFGDEIHPNIIQTQKWSYTTRKGE